jgi:plasmid stability protein
MEQGWSQPVPANLSIKNAPDEIVQRLRARALHDRCKAN